MSADKHKAGSKRKVLYEVLFDDLGYQCFVELSNGAVKFVTGWCENDADYRDEYMASLIHYFGGSIKQLPGKCVNKARAALPGYMKEGAGEYEE